MTGVKLVVRGRNACFTRPEMKVECVSYDVITPSAARGILEAIHWKPAIRWVIDRIHVLEPIRFQSIRRVTFARLNCSGIGGRCRPPGDSAAPSLDCTIHVVHPSRPGQQFPPVYRITLATS